MNYQTWSIFSVCLNVLDPVLEYSASMQRRGTRGKQQIKTIINTGTPSPSAQKTASPQDVRTSKASKSLNGPSQPHLRPLSTPNKPRSYIASTAPPALLEEYFAHSLAQHGAPFFRPQHMD